MIGRVWAILKLLLRSYILVRLQFAEGIQSVLWETWTFLMRDGQLSILGSDPECNPFAFGAYIQCSLAWHNDIIGACTTERHTHSRHGHAWCEHQSHGRCIYPNELCLLMQHQPTLKQMAKKASKLAQKAVKEAAVQPLLPAPEQMFGKTMDMPLTSSASRPLAFTPSPGINFRPSICLVAGHLQGTDC